MQLTQNNTLADIFFSMEWEKDGIKHDDSYLASGVDFWQDYFPDAVKRVITGRPEGYRATLHPFGGHVVPEYSEDLLMQIRPSQLVFPEGFGVDVGPRKGRYYPKGMLRDICGIYRQNVEPFRFIGKNGKTATVDFNHPLSGVDPALNLEIGRVEKNNRKHGGASADWIDLLVSGPGMQARFQNRKTDFLAGNAFHRDDTQPDEVFYRKERMVSHIDDRARGVLQDIYGTLLENGMSVLDLMASWQSHLPDEPVLKHLDGIGLNEAELAANSRLSDYLVHDLNRNPVLPYPDHRFDAVICSLSVEYLTRPFAVFRDVARVLKPGGKFVAAFSNRWFPPKAIEVWKHIHEFERMALVTEYFLNDGCFENIHTVSRRGYPRPYTDKYFPGVKVADPIYVVHGRRV